jgi:hypothetical protein
MEFFLMIVQKFVSFVTYLKEHPGLIKVKTTFFEKTRAANKRLLFRSFMFLGLTVCGFVALEHMVELSRTRGSDLILKYPELLTVMRAATIMTFAEMTVLWVRIISQPAVDVQAPVPVAQKEPLAAAVVYLTHAVMQVFRVLIFLKLCEFL